jgi:branched-chain amino acid transport system permease protein
MALLLQQLVNGITMGGTYALVALGFTLIFGVLDIIQMAHGEIFSIGALMAYVVIGIWHGGFWSGLLVAMAAAAAMGYVVELVALRPLRARGADYLAPLISTIGLSIIIQEVLGKLFGAEPLAVRTDLAQTQLQLGPVKVAGVQVLVLVISLALMGLMQVLLRYTRLGRAMRAVAENPRTAALLGVNVGAVIVLTMMLASSLGGAAGVLVGVTFQNVNAAMGLSYSLKGLAVIVLGGLGHFTGAVVGGLALGVVEALTVAYGGSGWRDAVAFGFLFLVLVLRPNGLFGRQLAGRS